MTAAATDRSLRFWHVAERGLSIQNPISARHVLELGRSAHLGPGRRVLDLACGKGGPALILATNLGCSVVGVERSPAFVRQATRRFARQNLSDRIRLIQQDAREPFKTPGDFHLAMCLGATFVLGGLLRTALWLRERVSDSGYVAVGECYLRADAPPAVCEAAAGGPDGFVDLPTTIARFEAAGLRLVGLHGANREDWDHYASTIWSNVETYARHHPDDPDTEYFVERMRRMQAAYLEWERDYLGWALLLARRV